MMVGSRIAVPAGVMAGIGWFMTPYLRSIGALSPKRSVPQDRIPRRASR